MRPILILPLIVIGTGSCAFYALGFRIAADADATRVYPFLYYPLFAGYLAAAWWVWRNPGVCLKPVLIFAVLFRLAVLFDPPSLSSDVYRYAWDGRVQRAGISPYAYPPGDPALAELRDETIHPKINRPTAPTIYPPGAQVFFLGLPYHLGAIRFVMIGFDLLTLGLLVWLLRRLSLDPARVVLYAWAPLVVYEVANNAHLEAVVLPLIVGAAIAHRAKRIATAGLLVGGAAALKLYPALAALAFVRPNPRRLLAPLLAVPVLLYAIYGAIAGGKIVGFLPQYVGAAEDYNIGIRSWIELILSVALDEPRTIAFVICLLGMVAGMAILTRRGGEAESQLQRIAGLFLLTLPTAFHPWYALWLVPWLCVRPRASWLWLIGVLPLSYLQYSAPGGVMPGWVVPLELIPTLGLIAYESRRA